MKLFLTGATGYIGHSLAMALARSGSHVQVLTRNLQSPNLPEHKNIIPFKGDLSDRSSIAAALKGCDKVFHTAAMVRIWAPDPVEFYKVNVAGTRNLLEESVTFGIEKFVFTSTCGVLGQSNHSPVAERETCARDLRHDYDMSKHLAENLVKEYFQQKGLSSVIVSLPKVYGPGIETHPVSVNVAIRNFANGRLTFVPSPSSYLSNYCFIDDVVRGHLLAMEFGLPGEKYILAGENISYADFFAKLRTLASSKARVIAVPQFVVKSIAAAQWLRYKVSGTEPLFGMNGIGHLFCNKAFTSLKAMREIGYAFTPLEEGLEKTLAFFKTTDQQAAMISLKLQTR